MTDRGHQNKKSREERSGREAVTFSAEPGFRKLLNKKTEELGYPNTSKMIRDAIQQFFESERNLRKTSGVVTTLISVVYDHHDLETLMNYIELQHHSNIKFTSHFHVTEDECLEIILLTAPTTEILEFQKKLREIKGLKYVSLNLIARINQEAE